MNTGLLSKCAALFWAVSAVAALLGGLPVAAVLPVAIEVR